MEAQRRDDGHCSHSDTVLFASSKTCSGRGLCKTPSATGSYIGSNGSDSTISRYTLPDGLLQGEPCRNDLSTVFNRGCESDLTTSVAVLKCMQLITAKTFVQQVQNQHVCWSTAVSLSLILRSLPYRSLLCSGKSSRLIDAMCDV